MEHQEKKFLEYVVAALVDNPDEVTVERRVDEMGVLLTLTVSQADMGKIIGRSGNTAKAIRSLLRVVGMKNDARVNLKINEPDGSEYQGRPDESETRSEDVKGGDDKDKDDEKQDDSNDDLSDSDDNNDDTESSTNEEHVGTKTIDTDSHDVDSIIEELKKDS